MTQPDNGKNWYALKIFFGKGKTIKAYLLSQNIEHIYDVKREYWDKNKKKRLVKEVPIMPTLILFRTTKVEAEATERKFLNKVMLYRSRNADNMTSGIEELDFYDEYNPKFTKGDKFRVIEGPLKGAEGYVVRIKKDHKLYVSIKGLCAVTTGYIPKAYLQKIE